MTRHSVALAPVAPFDPLSGIEAARLTLYVHFPYCISKCPYCDFASVVARSIPHERYAAAIRRELELRLERFASLRGRRLDALYVGGGTPSLWEPARLAEVLEAVRGALPLAGGAEVTLEANPEAADRRRLEGFRAAGFNRLSLGAQSFDPGLLRALGREHGPEAVEGAVGAARAAGFGNVSLDLIYGIQGERVAQAREDALRAVALEPEHVSAYALTLDAELLAEPVPLARRLARGEISLPEDERVLEMEEAVASVLEEGGLHRYEISNHARPGFHSRHNLAYWTGGDYLALGAGATGFVGGAPGGGAGRETASGERYSNHRSAERYLDAVESGELPEREQEPLDAATLLSERIAMGLRLATGIDLRTACEAAGVDAAPRLARLEPLLAGGLVSWSEERLTLTERGRALHSAVAAHLM